MWVKLEIEEREVGGVGTEGGVEVDER